jgi:hypothetical protein
MIGQQFFKNSLLNPSGPQDMSFGKVCGCSPTVGPLAFADANLPSVMGTNGSTK